MKLIAPTVLGLCFRSTLTISIRTTLALFKASSGKFYWALPCADSSTSSKSLSRNCTISGACECISVYSKVLLSLQGPFTRFLGRLEEADLNPKKPFPLLLVHSTLLRYTRPLPRSTNSLHKIGRFEAH